MITTRLQGHVACFVHLYLRDELVNLRRHFQRPVNLSLSYTIIKSG